MQARSSLLRIHDMLEAIRGIEQAVKGKSYRDYQRSWILRRGDADQDCAHRRMRDRKTDRRFGQVPANHP